MARSSTHGQNFDDIPGQWRKRTGACMADPAAGVIIMAQVHLHRTAADPSVRKIPIKLL